MAKPTDELSSEHELLLAYIEDELSADQRAAFETILDERPELAELTRRLKADRQQLARLTPPPPPRDLTEIAIEAVERSMLLDGPPARRPSRVAKRSYTRPLIYASAAILCLLCGGVVWQSLTTGSSLINRLEVATIDPQTDTPPSSTATPDAPQATIDDTPSPTALAESTDQPAAGMRGTSTAPTEPAPAAEKPNPLTDLLTAARRSAAENLTPAQQHPPLTLTSEQPDRIAALIEDWSAQRALPIRRSVPSTPTSPAAANTPTSLNQQTAQDTVTLTITGPAFALEALRERFQQSQANPEPAFARTKPTSPNTPDRAAESTASAQTDLDSLLNAVDPLQALTDLIPLLPNRPIDPQSLAADQLTINIVKIHPPAASPATPDTSGRSPSSTPTSADRPLEEAPLLPATPLQLELELNLPESLPILGPSPQPSHRQQTEPRDESQQPETNQSQPDGAQRQG
ncbi:hypothetical protein [Mucisphaera sp.]|uniref:anti-sigma factor family protein n=1 Tax=Mucisphaera sp. TaxID=2913024 RepID=UPI003D0B3DB1